MRIPREHPRRSKDVRRPAAGQAGPGPHSPPAARLRQQRRGSAGPGQGRGGLYHRRVRQGVRGCLRRPLVRQRGPRPGRAGRGRGGADAHPGLRLGVRRPVQSPRHTAGGEAGPDRPGGPEGHLLHHRRRGIQRVGLQDRPLLLEHGGQAREGEDHLPGAGLPRRHRRRHVRHRHEPVLAALRPRPAGLLPHPHPLLLPLPPAQGAAGVQPGLRRHPGAADPGRGPGHRGGLHSRAGPRGRGR